MLTVDFPFFRKISEKHDKVFVSGCLEPDTSKPRANATFVVLARNKEIDGVIQSIKSVERHFNRWYNYGYVFLNDGDFDDNFKETVMNHTSGTCEFGKVGPEMWGFPDWIDPKVAKEGIAKQGDNAVMYGGLESYHSMCRFYSGFFFNHPLLLKYEWYWRVEPEITYFCDITYDPFLEMIEHKKTYGFTIAIKELKETVPNLFRYASAYMRTNNITSQGLWEMFTEPKEKKDQADESKSPTQMTSDDITWTEPVINNPVDIDPDAMEGEKYNMCHFWSNFEIARLDWFRSKEYQDFFEMMDRSGGFWMERVSLFANRASCIRMSKSTRMLTIYLSGVTLLFTRSPPVHCLVLRIFTTSVTLVTDTPQSSTAPPTPLHASFLARHTCTRPLWTRRHSWKRTNIGRLTTSPRRMV